MIAAKTREESQIKFGMVKKRVGGVAFSFDHPSPPPPPPFKKTEKKRYYSPGRQIKCEPEFCLF